MNFFRRNFKRISYTALAFVAIITVLSFYELRNIKFDYDFESFFPQDDPDLDKYIDFRNTFEYDNEFILLAIENKEKVIHAICLLQPRPVLPAPTLLWRCNLKGTQPRQDHVGLYLVSARLVLPKYGRRKGSKSKNRDAPASTGASRLVIRNVSIFHGV